MSGNSHPAFPPTPMGLDQDIQIAPRPNHTLAIAIALSIAVPISILVGAIIGFIVRGSL